MTDATKSNPYRYSLTTRLKESELLKQMDASEGDMILDLGCGMGYFTHIMGRKGAICFGMDFSFPSLKFARDEGPGFYLKGSSEDIPFKDNSFGKVLFTDVIEHLEDEEPALKEIARVLKPSGELVITTPAKAGLLNGTKLNLLFHDQPGTPEYHYRIGYTSEELNVKMNNQGIKLTKVRYTTTMFGEVFTQLLKLLYSFIEDDFATQADSIKVKNSITFKIYKQIVFPVLYIISRTEDILFSRIVKGHLLLVKGKVVK